MNTLVVKSEMTNIPIQISKINHNMALRLKLINFELEIAISKIEKINPEKNLVLTNPTAFKKVCDVWYSMVNNVPIENKRIDVIVKLIDLSVIKESRLLAKKTIIIVAKINIYPVYFIDLL